MITLEMSLEERVRRYSQTREVPKASGSTAQTASLPD